MDIYTVIAISMAISLLATLVLESVYALLWGVRREDFKYVLLGNVMTNPAVVLLAWLSYGFDFGSVYFVLLLELAAVVVEALFYAGRTKIRFPWAFSLCANALSFIIGLFPLI